MEKIPEVSVVIVTYNHGKYIAQAIQSVLEQTFQDFEIIVFDDGSADNTREIVSSFSDKRIKYFYQPNSGLPACGRNRGIGLSMGKYISLLDGDDFWCKEKLEKSKEALDKMQEVSLVCHNEAILYNGRILRRTVYGPNSENMYSKLLFNGNCLHSSAVTLRREIFFNDGMKFSEDKNLFTIEDYEYWLRLSQQYRFYFLPEVLGYYRLTESGAFLRSIESNTLNMLCLINSHFEKIEHKTKEMQEILKRRRSSIICAAGRMFHHRREFRESRQWYRKAISENRLNYKAYICYLAALLNLRIVYN